MITLFIDTSTNTLTVALIKDDKVLEEYGIDLKVEQEFVNWD